MPRRSLRKPLDAEGVPLGGKGKISIEEFADARENSDEEERKAELLRGILTQNRRERRLKGELMERTCSNCGRERELVQVLPEHLGRRPPSETEYGICHECSQLARIRDEMIALLHKHAGQGQLGKGKNTPAARRMRELVEEAQMWDRVIEKSGGQYIGVIPPGRLQ